MTQRRYNNQHGFFPPKRPRIWVVEIREEVVDADGIAYVCPTFAVGKSEKWAIRQWRRHGHQDTKILETRVLAGDGKSLGMASKSEIPRLNLSKPPRRPYHSKAA